MTNVMVMVNMMG